MKIMDPQRLKEYTRGKKCVYLIVCALVVLFLISDNSWQNDSMFLGWLSVLFFTVGFIWSAIEIFRITIETKEETIQRWKMLAQGDTESNISDITESDQVWKNIKILLKVLG
ncbi:MAG: hypothetical protein V1763_02615, partial [Parcubacteria group bacterium]